MCVVFLLNFCCLGFKEKEIKRGEGGIFFGNVILDILLSSFREKGERGEN